MNRVDVEGLPVPGTTWLIWALPLGAALDAAIGDPRAWMHPVRAIGRLTEWAEHAARALTRDARGAERLAGAGLAIFVVSVTALSVWAIVAVGDRLGGVAALLVRAILIYWALAARSLGDEALRAAEAPDLATARQELAQIVGRDTAELDRPEIYRACVETVAENTCDGVVAPLFWFALAGPVGMWAFKAISTLDSMVGYRNQRYERLGWASARLDDLAALVPARLTWVLVAQASLLLGERSWGALRIGWRDARKHFSPNSGWGEAATAGALGVQLGGPASYGGNPRDKPLLGDPTAPIEPGTVRRAVQLMQVAALLAVALAWAVRLQLSGAA